LVPSPRNGCGGSLMGLGMRRIRSVWKHLGFDFFDQKNLSGDLCRKEQRAAILRTQRAAQMLRPFINSPT
jgi:hypothetical protein